MNITINRMEMLGTARRMASIAPDDSPLEVLHGVLLEADAGSGKLALTATSLELSLMGRLPCTATESGAFAIDAQMLTGMVEKLPEDTVEIIHPEGGAAVTLRSGCAQYTVPIWPRSSFPKLEIPFPEDTVKVSGIPDMAKRTVFAVSTEAAAGSATSWMLRTNWPGMISSPQFPAICTNFILRQTAGSLSMSSVSDLHECSIPRIRFWSERGWTGRKIERYSL